MSKNNKKFNTAVHDNIDDEVISPPVFYRRSAPKYPVEFPTPVSMDVIARYLDDELYSHLSQMENDRNKVIEAKLDPSPWEIEIAYLRREMGIRKTRREIHEEFVRNNAELLSMIDEESDLDYVSV